MSSSSRSPAVPKTARSPLMGEDVTVTVANDNQEPQRLLRNGYVASDEHEEQKSSNVTTTTIARSSSPPTRKKSLYDENMDQSSRELYLQVESMTGYQFSYKREIRYWLACLLSAGIIWLVNLWFFASVVPWRYRRVTLAEATYVFVVGRVHGAEMLPVKRLGEEEEKVVEDHPESLLPSSSSIQGRRDSRDLLHSGTRQRYLLFRHMRFIFSNTAGTFIMQQSDVNNMRLGSEEPEKRHQNVAALKSKEVNARMRTGLTQEQWYDNLMLYGQNALILEVPSIPSLLFNEVFHPFYVFQMYSVALWIFEVYYIFAGTIAFIAVVSIVQTLVETRRRMRELSELARFDCPVTVLRNSSYQTISSTMLVPGDIVQVQTGLLPCDLALLDGGAVVNESSLTGESVPVVKVSVQFPVNRNSDAVMPVAADARNTLFSATKILQLKPSAPDAKVLAMVIRTGFATTKGSLILSILYPKPSEFKFEKQSYKFIAALFALSLVGFGISVWQLKVVQEAGIQTIIIRGLDLITIVVPPSLPLALTVGVNFALLWLRDELIFCISPSRISMAGKIRCFCFDKTGTLTAESLEFMGVYPRAASVPNSPAVFGSFQSPHTRRPQMGLAEKEGQMHNVAMDDEVSPSPVARRPHDRVAVDTTHTVALSAELKMSMACCQSLAVMDGELIGDPLEIQTFEASNANLQDTGELRGFQQLITVRLSTEQSVTFGVREQFEFSSALARMSVLVENLNTHESWVYAKGSPEGMQQLCVPESIPADYADVLSYFAHQGYRVIAIAQKQMENIPRIDKAELRVMAEQGLTFLGLIVLENKVKPESKPTLQILHAAAVRCVMITGDHAQTACTVAKDCGLVPSGTRVFLSTIVPDEAEPNGRRIEWVDTDDDTLKLDPLTLRLPPHVLADSRDRQLRYELAVTGPVFKMLQDDAASSSEGSQFHRVVLNAQIFARMSPDQKASVISELQNFSIYTGMCGDGANDCNALKAAHCGVSLSESEASIAAPFTYQRPNISCIPILLSEGRSSLVTSFQLFRYMAMYSMIQFGAVILTYFQGSVLGNWQYLYEDLWLVFPLTILMGSTRANRTLTVKRPSGNLLSFQNLSNLLVHILLCIGFQIHLYEVILNQPNFVKLPNPDYQATSYITTCMYYFSNFQYTIIAVFFALGRPWKANLLTNWKFVLWAFISFAASAALLLSPLTQPSFFRTDDQDIFGSWKRIIVWHVLVFVASTFVWDIILSPLVVRAFKRWYKSGAAQGSVFGRVKNIEGPHSKLYHRLRGEFEAGWTAQVY